MMSKIIIFGKKTFFIFKVIDVRFLTTFISLCSSRQHVDSTRLNVVYGVWQRQSQYHFECEVTDARATRWCCPIGLYIVAYHVYDGFQPLARSSHTRSCRCRSAERMPKYNTETADLIAILFALETLHCCRPKVHSVGRRSGFPMAWEPGRDSMRPSQN